MNVLYEIHEKFPFLFTALAVFIPFALLCQYTYRRTIMTDDSVISSNALPLPIRFSSLDYIKAFLAWMFLFNKLFYIRPCIYYTGKFSDNTPLLVTCNNYLTVFLLARRIAGKSIRLLIINTNGINVWCSAGEGTFSASEIIDKASHAGLLREGKRTKMILPKLCLSGVKLSDLREAGIDPVIGPMYAKDLPAYLDEGKFEDRIHDHTTFGMQSRAFTALPTSCQFFYWSLGAYIITFWAIDISIVWVAALLGLMYPLLYPMLPGRQFAVKGISMGAIASILVIAHYVYHGFNMKMILFWILFVFATSIFIGLSFTGNSPVSNYDKVRKETARFLPVVVILYLLIIPVKIFFE